MERESNERPQSYVYGLRAKESSEYFYIGSTTRPDFSYRLRGHFRPNNRNKALEYRLRQIGKPNVVIELIEAVPTKKRFDREYEIIANYKAKGHALLNMVLTNEPPVWVRTPDRDLRDLVILLENCVPNDSWISWYCGIQVLKLKTQYSDPRSTTPTMWLRIQGLRDFPERPMPTAEEVLRPLRETKTLKEYLKLFWATCQILNIKPQFAE